MNIEEIKVKYPNGITRNQLIDCFMDSRMTIRNIVKMVEDCGVNVIYPKLDLENRRNFYALFISTQKTKSVSKCLNYMGINDQTFSLKLTTEREENIVNLYKNDYTIREIATATGFCEDTVRYALTKHKLYQKRKIRSDAETKEVFKLAKNEVEQGMTIKDACKKYHLSPTQYYYHMEDKVC